MSSNSSPNPPSTSWSSATRSLEDCDDALALTRQRPPPIRTLDLTSGSSDCGSHATDAALEATDGPTKLINAIRSRLN